MDKWTKKYMKLAKTLAEDNTACYSRKIGVFLATKEGEPLSMGYNGSVTKSPHNDDPEYLAHLWDNMLTFEDKVKLNEGTMSVSRSDFINQHSGCKVCPRRILGIPSGERLELCNCSHAERNAIFNAAKRGISTVDSVMYCWCACPCHECAIAIIQSKISRVVCLKTESPDYSKSSRHLFRMAAVELDEVDPKFL